MLTSGAIEMSFELFENAPALLPLEFFSLSTSISHAPFSLTALSSRAMRSSHSLPDTTELLGEEKFGDVALAWNEEGLCVHAFIDKPFEEASFPAFSKGDALELFFDTRDLKTAGFATRFCHHFVILPQAVQEVQALEMTHFRTEDTHPLCDPNDLIVHADMQNSSYSVRILIPSACLHGYDPKSYDRMGFTYRIHRYKGAPQHFAVSSQHFAIEQLPRLWASLTMKK
jgi:hypothetical protein